MILRAGAALCGRPYVQAPASALIIAPHPDDEVLGCAGLILQELAGDAQVRVVVLTGGERSHECCCTVGGTLVKNARRGLARRAGDILGLEGDHQIFLDWGDGQLGQIDKGRFHQRAEELAAWIARLRPEAVFAPHPFEGWPDHTVAERITKAAIERSGVACTLFHYCVWFWFSMPLRRAVRIDWRRARLLDIEDVYERKRAAMDAYLAPCAPCGKPWSGVLPRELVRAFRWKKELFFEAEVPGKREASGRRGERRKQTCSA
jgi:LmbE family N-acetylglucosaminyl deacetylase